MKYKPYLECNEAKENIVPIPMVMKKLARIRESEPYCDDESLQLFGHRLYDALDQFQNMQGGKKYINEKEFNFLLKLIATVYRTETNQSLTDCTTLVDFVYSDAFYKAYTASEFYTKKEETK